MAIEHIEEIICEPGTENEFAIANTWIIDTFNTGDWNGASGAPTKWYSDTPDSQVEIQAPSGVIVLYSYWKDINNTGTTIDASDPSNVNGGNNSGITFAPTINSFNI